LRLENAVGSQNTALPVQIRTQYWNGSGFATNTLDACTSIPRSAIVVGGYVGALDPGGGNCKTFIQEDPVTFTAGVGAITLALPTGAASGSVLLTANLGTTASGLYCDDAASGENAATAAALSHLQGRWAGANYTDNPSARAAFGLYGAKPRQFIYFRENY
jgi:MSHA biogenesis protein MshQ